MWKGAARGTVPPEKLEKFLDSVIDASLRHYGGERAATAAALLGSRRISRFVKNKYAAAIEAPEGDVLGDNKVVPAYGDIRSRMISGANHAFTSRVHSINFNAGYNPTKPVRQLQKLNGGSSINIFDTRENLQGASRAELTQTWGFNRKKQMMFLGLTHTTLSDLDDIYDFSLVNSSVRQQQRAYGCTMNLNNRMVITNINKYLPCYVKIYMLKCTNWADNNSQILNKATSVLGTGQTEGAMPINNQLTSLSSGAHQASVEVDIRSNGVFSSSVFKSSYEVVKVFKQKLYSGDILDFKYVHHTGPGVRLDIAHGILRNSDNIPGVPITYLPLIELSGPMVEAYDATDANIRHTGKGPGAVTFELKKGAYAIQTPLNKADVNLVTDGYENKQYLVRLFDKSVNQTRTTATQIFSAAYENVVPSGTGGTGNIVIPIMSDDVTVSTGSRT